MNDKYPYDFNQENSQNPEIKTSQNLETIERLFNEWDDEDKNTSENFSLDNQSFENNQANYNTSENTTFTSQNNSSFYNEPSYESHTNPLEDPMDKTQEIDSVNLEELKALRDELNRLYEEENGQTIQQNTSQTQSKGKTLTKATKQGIAFSNGNLTKTFLDCVVLCFVTASMGFIFLMNIINHI